MQAPERGLREYCAECEKRIILKIFMAWIQNVPQKVHCVESLVPEQQRSEVGPLGSDQIVRVLSPSVGVLLNESIAT